MTDMSAVSGVDETVFRQYEQVRRSGMTNMVMETRVRGVAESMGLDELVEFIDSGDYYEFLENYGEYANRFDTPDPGEL